MRKPAMWRRGGRALLLHACGGAVLAALSCRTPPPPPPRTYSFVLDGKEERFATVPVAYLNRQALRSAAGRDLGCAPSDVTIRELPLEESACVDACGRHLQYIAEGAISSGPDGAEVSVLRWVPINGADPEPAMQALTAGAGDAMHAAKLRQDLSRWTALSAQAARDLSCAATDVCVRLHGPMRREHPSAEGCGKHAAYASGLGPQDFVLLTVTPLGASGAP